MRKPNNGTTDPIILRTIFPNLLEARHNHRLVCVMVWHANMNVQFSGCFLKKNNPAFPFLR